ncbi:MAG: guanylate kinase [Chloroflexi bacterium]|nr:guanylate kinase [Chloroflexota bacterium]
MRQGRPSILFVLSGPSGVGKDAVIGRLKECGVPLHYTVTCTTRSIRPGEVQGVDYHFMSAECFADMEKHGDLLESANVHGNRYGTPLAQVQDALATGKDVLLKIDVQGAAKVKQRAPDAVFIFLAPPSMSELIGRLTNRRTESQAELETRVLNAYGEMKQLPEYDYVVVNYADRLDEAVSCIRAIISAEGCRVQPRQVKL